MPDLYKRERILIWGKTYPELSSKYTETVCTGGVREDGSAVRLYPVPLRYLKGESQYKLYQIIEVGTAVSSRDPRPESRKIDANSLVAGDRIETDSQGWAARREWIDRDRSWHFDSMDALQEQHIARNLSMGLVTPGAIVDVKMTNKPPTYEKQFTEKWEQVTAQSDLFLPEYKTLGYVPVEFKLHWKCANPCRVCQKSPHKTLVLDWGLMELGRREGDWRKSLARLEDLADLKKYSLRLFMGNMFLHPSNFSVIGMWYPKLSPQTALF